MVLDTNIVTTFLRPEARARTPKLVEFVEASLLAEGIAISFVTQFELRRGLPASSQPGTQRLRACVAAISTASAVSALARADSERTSHAW